MKFVQFDATATLVAVLAFSALSAATSTADAKSKFVEIEIPGATQVGATDINDADETTGWYIDGAGTTHGFLRTKDGSITTFDVPDATGTDPVSINAAGEISGNASPQDGFVRAPDGTTQSFSVTGAAQTNPTAINKRGHVAGGYTTPDDFLLGFIRKNNGSIQTFDPSMGTSSFVEVADINKNDVIVGYYFDLFTHSIGFMRAKDGTIENIAMDGAQNIQPAAINSTGFIAGNVQPIGGGYEGFIRDPLGNFTTFLYPLEGNANAVGMNDKNWVVGIAYSGNDPLKGFVRTADGTIIPVNNPNAGDGIGEGTSPYAINGSGHVVGSYIDSNRHSHGFIIHIQQPQ